MSKRILKASAVAMLAMVMTAGAEGVSVPGWTFSVTPYVSLPQLNGDVTVDHHTAPVDVSFSDSAKSLDEIKGVFMLHGEAQHGLLSGWGDVCALTLGEDNDTMAGDTTVRLTQYIGELGAGWALPVQATDFRVEAIGGARYQMYRIRIIADEMDIDADATRYWTDPFVGIRAMYTLNQSWLFSLRGDIGGFGIGSDLTLNAVGTANWIINKDWSANLAYRYMDVDYNKDGFIYDVTMDGPAIGVTYTF